tara:strand:- start:912 stop:1073 length:162 start_codon:yes stop_codon:yes gene_type:complete
VVAVVLVMVGMVLIMKVVMQPLTLVVEVVVQQVLHNITIPVVEDKVVEMEALV